MGQTDPSHPDFDIDAWLDRRQELREKHPDNMDGFFPTGPALLLGFSDCVTAEQDAEQERRLGEWKRQQEEAKQEEVAPVPTASHRSAS